MAGNILLAGDLQQAVPDLQLVEERLAAETSLNDGFMQQLAAFVLRGRGKRLRPALVLLCASFYPAAAREAVIDVATAVELIHTASLVHDDIVDEAARRRGRVTINAGWGNKAAVLVGDYLFARAFSLLSNKAACEAMRIMTETISMMCEGELEQLQAPFNVESSEDGYFHYVLKKTGCLLGACCEVGGRLCGLDSRAVLRLRDYGRQLGSAFQIIDDIFDLSADPGEIGKPTGIDLRQGKITLPLIYMLRHGDYGPLLRRLLGGAAAPVSFDCVRRLAHQSGALHYARRRAERWVAEAKNSLAALPSGEVKEMLVRIADYVLERRR